MSENATTPTTGRGRAKTAAAAAKPKKPKAPSSHPKYMEMSVAAINALKERNGSSRQAILKYITGHYSVGKDAKIVNTHLKMALKRGVSSGVLKHAKGQGATGSFRVSEKAGPVAKKPVKKAVKAKAPVAEKVKVEAVKKPKKTPKKKKKKEVAAVKVKAVKKAKSPKKVVVEKKKSVKAKKTKTPKKAVAKKPASKPKKLKSPKKARK